MYFENFMQKFQVVFLQKWKIGEIENFLFFWDVYNKT